MPIARPSPGENPLVAEYEALGHADLLRARGMFVAEGRLVVRRVLEGGYDVRSILVNPAALADLAAAIEKFALQVPVMVVETADFARITGFNIHRGCLALVHRPRPLSVVAVVSAAKRLIVLDGVTNPDNIGGVFRNAAAFAVDGVLLSPTCCDPLYRKSIRTSMAAVLQVPFARVDGQEWPHLLPRLSAEGVLVAALTPRPSAITIDAFAARTPTPERIALVVGTEGTGLSADVEAAAAVCVRIAVSDRVDSLNLAVATGIALHRLRVDD